jgi:hypothetical protein
MTEFDTPTREVGDVPCQVAFHVAGPSSSVVADCQHKGPLHCNRGREREWRNVQHPAIRRGVDFAPRIDGCTPRSHAMVKDVRDIRATIR